MQKTLMHSVISELQKERKRLEDELHRVAAALTAFGNVYMHGSRPARRPWRSPGQRWFREIIRAPILQRMRAAIQGSAVFARATVGNR